MTRDEILEELDAGEKVAHESFEPGEYFFIDDDAQIKTEEGINAERRFTESMYDKGWTVYNGV